MTQTLGGVAGLPREIISDTNSQPLELEPVAATQPEAFVTDQPNETIQGNLKFGFNVLQLDVANYFVT